MSLNKPCDGFGYIVHGLTTINAMKIRDFRFNNTPEAFKGFVRVDVNLVFDLSLCFPFYSS